MKRLRKHFSSRKIRFFHCGEYGEQFQRPHYHAIIFGLDFTDKVQCRENFYISPTLAVLWPFGFHTIGSVTFESAAYVARYVVKKVTGKFADEHYAVINKRTGEYCGDRLPEYITMSRRPGIAADWIDKWKFDVYNSDSVIINGREVKPPKFYDAKFELVDKEAMARIKAVRKCVSPSVAENNWTGRLRVREEVAHAKLNNGRRRYEQD